MDFLSLLPLLQDFWAFIAMVVAGIGSFVIAYWRFKKEKKDSVNARFDQLYQEINSKADRLEKENQRLRDKQLEFQAQQTKLLVEYTEMKTKWETILGTEHKDLSIDKLIEFGVRQKRLAETLDKFVTTFPGLLWMKEVEKDHSGEPINFRIFAISQKYTDLFLNSNRDLYIGKNDSEVWDEETADEFRENDKVAYNSRLPIKVVEMLQSNISNEEGIFVGYKWNLSVEGIDYICGYGDYYDERTEGYDYWKEKYDKDALTES